MDVLIDHDRPDVDTLRDQAQVLRARLEEIARLYNYKAKLLCKDGSTLSVLIASSGLFDEEKNFVHTRCFTIKDPAP